MASRSRQALWLVSGVVMGCAVYENDLVRPTDLGQGSTMSGGSAPSSSGSNGAGRATGGSLMGGGMPALGEGGDSGDSAGVGGSSSGGAPAALAGESAGGSAGLGGGGLGMSDGGSEASAGRAAGGEGGEGGSRSVCSVNSVGSGLLGSIDDFDDGDAQLQPIDGRSGSWVFTSDGTGMTTPVPGAPLPVAGGVSGKALHLQGSGLSGEGASLHAQLALPGGCYDASAYRGINVALKGTGEVWLVVRIAAIDGKPAMERDYHRVKLPLNAGWTTYTLLWAQLAQAGAGGAAPVDFDPTSITGIDIVPTSNMTPLAFDFWVDNIAFRKMT